MCVSVYVRFHSVLLAEPTHMQRGKSSPAQSDEEYLSPQEEAMELGDAPAATKSVRFKEPPWFQVCVCGGGVSERKSRFLESRQVLSLSAP